MRWIAVVIRVVLSFTPDKGHFSEVSLERENKPGAMVWDAQNPLSKHGRTATRGCVHARARSTTYLPKEGSAAGELHDALFDEQVVAGTVTMRMKTTVPHADVSAAARP